MNNIHNFNSSQLEIFVAITEQGSFSEAAQVLGLTQSAVSHALARLETELGLVLVERGRRGVTLTKAGLEILPNARDVVSRMNIIRQIATASEGTMRGKLRLEITYPLPARLLMQSISAFRATYPEVEIIIVEDFGAEGKNRIAEGLVDVGIVTHPASGVESRLIMEDYVCAVMNTEHSLARQTSVSLEQLFNEPLIIPRLGWQLVSEALRKQGENSGRPQVRHMVSDLQMIWEMAHSGIAVALLSEKAFTEINRPKEGLVGVPLSPPLLLPLSLAVRSWDAASPVTKRFIETTIDSFRVASAQGHDEDTVAH